MNLANRVKNLSPSSTLAISAMAKEMKDNGIDVIGLGAGEPDFNTPIHIIKAAEQAMMEGKTKYTPSGGIQPLKLAIQQKLHNDQQLHYDIEQIVVTSGAKHALYTLFQVLLNKGDEVLIPSPYWVSYPEQVKLAGGQPVIVETNSHKHFKITEEQLRQAITSRTKALILNSPNNPTGMMYTREELQLIGAFCLKHNLYIISDEIYEALTYTSQKHVSIAQLSDRLKDLTIVINGFSKSHAMTGWRIGYAAGDRKIIQAMTHLISHSTSNPMTIAQYAALKAYTSDSLSVENMRNTFAKRLENIYELLIDIPGITCIKPLGAFYMFPNVKEAANKKGYHSVDEWVTGLLEKEKVAVVPGSGFGAPDHVRLSFAASLDSLIESIHRIKRFCET